MRRILLSAIALSPLSAAIACGGEDAVTCGANDAMNNASGFAGCDGVPDDLPVTAVRDINGNWAQADLNGDGVGDGPAVDINGDGLADGILIDTDGDGLGDAVDLDGDFVADDITGGEVLPPSGTGGAPPVTGTGGMPANGGTPSTTPTGDPDMGGGCLLGAANSTASSGSTSARYHTQNVQRDGQNYTLITNGWGPAFYDQSISWKGTSFTVESMNGDQGGNYEPASYPSVFCGAYADNGMGDFIRSLDCGLPRALSSITSMNTGLRWNHSGSGSKYNVAYDVWLGNGGNSHTGYFMVWFRDPPGAQPAGSKTHNLVQVPGVGGVWDIWTGTVFGRQIINYVRPEGQDAHELAFDLKAFFDDATSRGISIPGSEILSVAIGFEMWQGPVTNLTAEDFCIDVQ